MGKYIIELDDKYVSPDNELIVSHKNLFDGDNYSCHVQVAKFTPYTEPDGIEKVRNEAYKEGREDGIRNGMCDAWDAAKKIYLPVEYGGIPADGLHKIFNNKTTIDIFKKVSASEAVEKIQRYVLNQEQETEKPTSAEDVMRQYLNEFCTRSMCTECVLYTPDFTCGRGFHFLSYSPVSDEEVRKAYFTVLKNKKE